MPNELVNKTELLGVIKYVTRLIIKKRIIAT